MSREMISAIARDFNKNMCSDREVLESCTECAGSIENSPCLLYEIATRIYKAGYRKQEWISVEERLPEENVYVLIAVENSIQVARIIKGISEEKREKMKNGELPDSEETCFAADKIITLRRSQLYRSGDVWGNNLVPYYWKANGGPMEWFGQNITHWMPLPEPPKMKGGEG